MNHRHLSLPAVRGGLLALLATALFGEALGALTTARLLYAGRPQAFCCSSVPPGTA
jgi:hypothetical protein